MQQLVLQRNRIGNCHKFFWQRGMTRRKDRNCLQPLIQLTSDTQTYANLRSFCPGLSTSLTWLMLPYWRLVWGRPDNSGTIGCSSFYTDFTLARIDLHTGWSHAQLKTYYLNSASRPFAHPFTFPWQVLASDGFANVWDSIQLGVDVHLAECSQCERHTVPWRSGWSVFSQKGQLTNSKFEEKIHRYDNCIVTIADVLERSILISLNWIWIYKTKDSRTHNLQINEKLITVTF